ncbi:uncharacterized protein LACBIDRAFT_170754 [Laccaria bicolor S238N-H82]|uniref:Mitochondrial import inner membrane translocase subunit n=1 Tax=Laccaria bicolor (strain S238N-H82 / ATCC MYA-4686) TaxID=486041 RepID=B0CQQ0_LACBS|nr:uncharacterized protein LACBIDRAFT_170754 [Laccaria bicolor S238N-H82]EDR15070.1 predicted protein [Laccaria bicolor S238N-H82]|eukprot:XP_001873278.1 predicted protein [Laccaria bicolor S238N-H82]
MSDNLHFDQVTQKELTSFIEREQAQAKLHASIQRFTDLCWDKCMSSKPSTSLSRAEESCLVNCVERFLDSSLHMVKELENKRAQLSG